MLKPADTSGSKFMEELGWSAFLLLLGLLIGWVSITIIGSKVTVETTLDWLKLVALIALDLLLAHFMIWVGFRFFKCHPMLCNIQQRANLAIEKLEEHVTFYDDAKKVLSNSSDIMKDARVLLEPHVLEKKGVIVIGSSHGSRPNHNELVEKVFSDYKNVPQSLGISFMGTAYGAFSLDSTKSSYGFLDALEAHVELCRGRVESPFGKIEFICGNVPLYSLSAKYLCLRICELINANPPMKIADIHIAYPRNDCIPALLIIEGKEGGDRALISPSIGQDDKKFLAEHYPIGIVIKNIRTNSQTESPEIDPATDTIKRLASQFDAQMAEIHEIWRYDRTTGLTITKLHRIKLVPELSNAFDERKNNKSDAFEAELFEGLMQSASRTEKILATEVEIPKNKIHDASDLFAFCISEIEKSLQSKG